MRKLDPSLLQPLAPFRGLAIDDLTEVLNRASSGHHAIESSIFREGEVADRFLILLDGLVRVVRVTATGEQVVVLHVPPGQLFGIAPALNRDTYPASAVAAADCVTLSWPRSCWDDFALHGGFTSAARKTVGERMAEIQARMIELATLQVEQRVAKAVLRVMQQAGRKQDDAIEITVPLTRRDISEMTGTTLHTVSRLMSAWKRDGIVTSGRRRVAVISPSRLMEIAERET